MDDFKWREIRNGRLAMVAFLGFLAQHAATGKGPIENLAGELPYCAPGCQIKWWAACWNESGAARLSGAMPLLAAASAGCCTWFSPPCLLQTTWLTPGQTTSAPTV